MVRSIIFLSPILFLYFFIHCLYSVNQGDLSRIGYLQRDDRYRALFENELNHPVCYTDVSIIDTNADSKYTVLVIGDSFSEWRGFSYYNYMAKNDTISVLQCDIEGNPLETLSALINGDFFERISIDYVILQSVERVFSARANLNQDSLILLNEMKQIAKKKPDGFKKNIPLDNSIVKYFVINTMRLYKEGAISGVYQFEATKPVFTSKHDDKIWIYDMDIYHLPENSDTTAIVKLNNALNRLSGLVSEKGSKLIVLPAPDKYNVYYDYISDRENYPQPVFFNILRSLEKQYIYVDSDEILKNAVSAGIMDVYFADDTHWSPVGAKLIAEAVKSKMKQ